MTQQAIPIVDITGLADPTSAAARDAARRLCDAYESVGFAYIAGHGVPDAIIEGAFAASADFHASTLAQKQSIAINRFHRGYIGMATSTIVTSTVARVSQPNLSESLMLMHEVAPQDPDFGKEVNGPNQWPDWLPTFRPAVSAYIAALEGVARRLLDAFALGLELPAGHLAPLFAKPVTFLRLLHYPPMPVEAHEKQYGSAPHTDYGFITILAQDTAGGLQVRSRDHAWIDATPLDGAFVVNVGDMGSRWTNGRWPSTPHRVDADWSATTMT